jgi:hypothetical protein
MNGCRARNILMSALVCTRFSPPGKMPGSTAATDGRRYLKLAPTYFASGQVAVATRTHSSAMS